MSKALVVIGVVFGGILLLALMVGGWFIGTHNNLVAQRTDVETSWSQVETQYQRRYDLIPQLVGAVKGTMSQEQAVFGAIADARTHYANSSSGSDDRVAATGEVEGALSRLLVVMENYPTLNSDGTIRMLMDELTGTANRVNVAQQRYNETVQVYNTHIQVFPASFVAGMFGFTAKPFFKSVEGASTAPTVDLQNIGTAASTTTKP